ncbi:MAG: hypothetical protein GQ582_11505 [Methyloprofundus sp.]|nr:hypothetical protein [Methyloprofundus sp.]
MQGNFRNTQKIEIITYIVMAVILLAGVYYLFYYDPVNYVVLIAEDKWAEYGTFVSFFIAGVLLLLLASKQGAYLPRSIWLVIGLLAIFIAGEEVSWGQRVFDIKTPSSIKQYNSQNELTLHNFKTFQDANKKLPAVLAYLILLWALLSLALTLFMRPLKQTLLKMGIPVLPMKLVPVFMLVPFFYLYFPTAKADELGELFLGLAVMFWVIDLFFIHYREQDFNQSAFLVSTIGALILVLSLSVSLTALHARPMPWRLNIMAVRDYPQFGMYQQSEVIYDYIYQHPEVGLRSNTHKDQLKMQRMAKIYPDPAEKVFNKKQLRWRRVKRKL